MQSPTVRLLRSQSKVSGMIVIPASLRSDFIHMTGMTIHIALESTMPRF
jgi:hypothetical protein